MQKQKKPSKISKKHLEQAFHPQHELSGTKRMIKTIKTKILFFFSQFINKIDPFAKQIYNPYLTQFTEKNVNSRLLNLFHR
jgi:hypothetical protein